MKIYGITLALVLSTFFLHAQPTGLWEVTLVQVGGETPTPTAKWFELRADGGMQSGNGGIINQWGRWQWDEARQELLFLLPGDEPDPAGPFAVELAGELMYWQREEEGMNVRIQLRAVTELPRGPWDEIQGNWRLERLVADGEEEILPEDPADRLQLYFRWDNLLVSRKDFKGRAEHWAAWQIHAHNGKLRIFSLDGKEHETWVIESIDDRAMHWSDGLREMWFVRD